LIYKKKKMLSLGQETHFFLAKCSTKKQKGGGGGGGWENS